MGAAAFTRRGAYHWRGWDPTWTDATPSAQRLRRQRPARPRRLRQGVVKVMIISTKQQKKQDSRTTPHATEHATEAAANAL